MKNRYQITEGADYLNHLIKDKEISDNIINHSRSMISIINRNYVYEKVNDPFCNAHQIKNNLVVGKSLEDVWGTKTFRKVIRKNIDLCFAGETIKYEASFNTPQHGERYFEVVFRPLSIDDKITHVLAETFDINDLRRSERAAHEMEEELRNFETNLPIGFLRCDVEGKILHANKAFMKIMDCLEEGSITNRNLKSFYQDKRLFGIQLDQLMQNNTMTFGRVYLKNCKKNDIPCRISGFLAMDSSGSPLFIDFAIEDATREMVLESRLLQAQKLETIGSLAGGIAHDFNNILTTISGYSELLQDDLPEDSDAHEKISKIQAAVIKAQSITSQILTFSRQVGQEKIQVGVSEILKETLGFIKSSVPPNITVKHKVFKKNPLVYADPTQLFRIFLNLMTNAFQAMDSRGGTLSVNVSVLKGELIKKELNKSIVADEYALITFKDTGEGMEATQMSRIFEPFYTTREVGKGTGLGLSVVHGIVSELEGEILVSSTKGSGSVFNIYLPVSEQYAVTASENDQKKRILFISGNQYESRILSHALKSSGYEIIYFSDSENLIKIINNKRGKPDLVIYMSDSEKIKSDDLTGIFTRMKIIIPCIIITDTNYDHLEEKLLNSGIVKQHLFKPVSLKEIRNAIHDSLS